MLRIGSRHVYVDVVCFSDESVETEQPKTGVWTDKPELHKIPLNKVNENLETREKNLKEKTFK